MSEHTKGPWFAATGWVGAGDVKDGRVIVRCEGFPYGNTEANLKLIAAAPELLEACTALLAALDEMCDWHGATHESDCPQDDTCSCMHKSFNDEVNAAYRTGEAAIAKAEGR